MTQKLTTSVIGNAGKIQLQPTKLVATGREREREKINFMQKITYATGRSLIGCGSHLHCIIGKYLKKVRHPDIYAAYRLLASESLHAKSTLSSGTALSGC